MWVMNMSSVLKEKWFWYIVVFLTLILIGPFVIIYGVLLLPPFWGPALFMVGLIIVWALVSGYKDWVKARQKEEEEKQRVGAA